MKRLFSLVLMMLMICSFGAFPVFANNSPQTDPNASIIDGHLDINKILQSKKVKFKKLSQSEIQKDKKAKSVYDELKAGMEKNGLTVESIEIYMVDRPASQEAVEQVICSPDQVTTMASCDYSGAYASYASASGYKGADNGGMQQHVTSYWEIFDPPSGHVGNYYKADYMETWWERTSTAYTVKNARTYLDVRALGWCGSVVSGTYTGNSAGTPQWKDNYTSYGWIYNWSNNGLAPVTHSSSNYIQVVAKSDIYKNGTKIFTDLTTQQSPAGL
ncbi:hypothetical protein [Aneurinibacillus tyrosinisolvens]|uniref:hypothetical protein n=1 Tax=Aneurinibacillus tyrosinisolvens TaxID=1443435 RepID=UPI00063F877D|nr:hypothetical protein [Aneurinibacillus tyrosinisolvens]